ncbi:MAG: pyridoxine 5'-phosphate synthase [Acidobacteria bacterium]|nr:pyridoxine 5'-phosphate synthase [Acidobacteriota bacterium]
MVILTPIATSKTNFIITEFNIGHNTISRAVFVGLNQSVKEMAEAIKRRSKPVFET